MITPRYQDADGYYHQTSSSGYTERDNLVWKDKGSCSCSCPCKDRWLGPFCLKIWVVPALITTQMIIFVNNSDCNKMPLNASLYVGALVVSISSIAYSIFSCRNPKESESVARGRTFACHGFNVFLTTSFSTFSAIVFGFYVDECKN